MTLLDTFSKKGQKERQAARVRNGGEHVQTGLDPGSLTTHSRNLLGPTLLHEPQLREAFAFPMLTLKVLPP